MGTVKFEDKCTTTTDSQHKRSDYSRNKVVTHRGLKGVFAKNEWPGLGLRQKIIDGDRY